MTENCVDCGQMTCPPGCPSRLEETLRANYTLPSGHAVYVDEENIKILNNARWYHHHGYVRAKINGHYQYLHREILRAPKGIHVDHINGNGLDNRLENLRLSTQANNCCNKRKMSHKNFKGVFFDKRHGTYWAQISKDKKAYFGGRYKNEVDAAKSYNELAIKHHGEFAKLNSIPKDI